MLGTPDAPIMARRTPGSPTRDDFHGAPVHAIVSPMRNVRTAALAAAIVPAILLTLLVGAWSLDTTVHAGQTMRNIDLAGASVGGLNDVDLFDRLTTIDAELAGRPVAIETPATTLETTAGEIGLALDQKTTVRMLSTIGREGPMSRRPFRWASSIFRPHSVQPNFMVASATLSSAMVEVAQANRTNPVEPSIELLDGKLRATPGIDGAALDLGKLALDIEASAERGDNPVRVTAAPVPVAPEYADELTVQLAEEANELTSTPLVVRVGDTAEELDPALQRRWVTTEAIGQRLLLAPRLEQITTDLEERFGDVATEPTPAAFDVVVTDNVARPVVLDGTPGQQCCDATASTIVWEAILRGQDDVVVGLGSVQHERDRQWAESLGVVELVGEFTTNHACCENRVHNIQLIADLTRGVLIPPGESFSVNEFVGRRTREKGFLSAGVIKNGVFADDVGGGISQYATTLFNAAFFAGLDFDEYQAHSIYISRYPYGREATLNYMQPDLKIRNSTPHTVLLWPTYTGTSITVQLFSTKTVVGEQTGQSTSPSGRCTRVTTERTRTYLEDGRTEVDTVFAVYRPAEGVNCS